MAIFNPVIDKTGDPSYLSLSRETDKPLPNPVVEGRPAQPIMPAAPAPPATPVSGVERGVDRSYEAMFKSLAQGVNIAATGIDAGIKYKLENELRDRYRTIQDSEFGVGAATELAAARVPPTDVTGDSTEPVSILAGPNLKSQGKGLPAGAQGIVSKMQKFEDLHKSGQISQSYYLGVMNAEMSKFKANYPGYAPEVEEFTKNILGVNPANALRASLMADMDAKARAQAGSQNSELKEILTHAKYLPPTAAQDYAGGKVSIWDIRKIYSQRMGAEYNREQDRAIRTDDKEDKEFRSERYLKNATRDYVTTSMNNETMSAQIDPIIQKWKQPGYQPTPQEQEQVLLNLAQKEKEIDQGIDALAKGIDPITGESRLDANNGSPSTYLKQEQIEAIRKQAKAPLEIYKGFIGMKDYSLAGRWAEVTKGLEDKRMLDFQKDFPAIAKWGMVNKLAGPNMAPLILGPSGDAGLLPPLVRDMQKFMHMDTVGNPDPPPQKLQLDKAQTHLQTPKEKAQFVKKDIDLNGSILSGEAGADDQHIKQVAKSVYHPGNNIFSSISPNDYVDVYTKYTQPAVTAKIMDVTKSDPIVGARYLKWATDNFPVATQFELRTLAQNLKYESRISVEFDPQTNLLRLDTSSMTREQRRNAGSYISSVEKNVQNINRNMNNLAGILEANKRDVPGTMQQIFSGMGVELNLGKEPAKKPEAPTITPLKFSKYYTNRSSNLSDMDMQFEDGTFIPRVGNP